MIIIIIITIPTVIETERWTVRAVGMMAEGDGEFTHAHLTKANATTVQFRFVVGECGGIRLGRIVQ